MVANSKTKPALPAPFADPNSSAHIGLIRGLSEGEFLERYLLGVQTMANELGLRLTEYDSHGDISEMPGLLRQALSDGVDALILDHGAGEELQEAAVAAFKSGIPVLTFDTVIDHPDIPEIEQNDMLIGFTISEKMMLDYGGRCDVIYVNSDIYSPLRKRHKAWELFTWRYSGLKINARAGRVCEDTASATCEDVARLLEERPNANVVLAMWDEFAKGAVKAVRRLPPGRDIRVYSVDITDEDIRMMTEPGSPWAATVATDARNIGRLAVRAVSLLLSGEKLDKYILVPPTLITQDFLRENRIRNMEELLIALPGLQESSRFWPDWMEVVLQRKGFTRPEVTLSQEELLQRLRNSKLELERRNTELTTASEVARDATAADNWDSLLRHASLLIRDRFQFDDVCIFLHDNDGADIHWHTINGAVPEDTMGLRANMERSIVAHVLRTGRSYICNDTESDPLYFGGDIFPLTRSELCLPMRSGGKTLGVVAVHGRTLNAFDAYDLRVMQTLADQLGVALERMKLFERSYETLENQLQAIISNAPVVLLALDKDGRVILAEGQPLSTLGVPSEQFTGVSVFKLFQLRPDLKKDIERVLCGEFFESIIKLGDLSFITRWTPLLDKTGQPDGAAIVATDITKRLEAENKLGLVNRNLEQLVEERTLDLHSKAQELEVANIRLKELDALKSSLLTTVSHDIRTPLTSVLGFAKLVHRAFSKHFSPLSKDDEILARKARLIHSNLEIIAGEGERLTRLINDFLDLSRIESGRMEWRDQLVDVQALLQQAARAVERLFSDSEVQFRVQAPSSSETSPQLFLDPDRLLQVLVNLLDNAYKFTRQGEVGLKAECLNNQVLFTVTDTGKGIPKDELAHIFNSFHQVHQGDTLERTDKGGSGLGLSICKVIVEHYGGVIYAESEEGKGSAFSFILPMYG